MGSLSVIKQIKRPFLKTPVGVVLTHRPLRVFLKKSDIEIVQQARSMHISTSRCGQKLSESRYSDGPLQRGCVGSRGGSEQSHNVQVPFCTRVQKGKLYKTTSMEMVVRMHKATLEWCTLKLRLAGV